MKNGSKLRSFTFALICISAAVLPPAPALAFNADGYTSWMTKEQVIALSSYRGLKAWENKDGLLLVGKPEESRIDGTFSFCNNWLVAYNRTIDLDAEYFPKLKELMHYYGQPVNVEAREIPWSGPGDGFLNLVDLRWYYGNDRADLYFNPEARDAKGKLKYVRAANISFSTRNACWSQF